MNIISIATKAINKSFTPIELKQLDNLKDSITRKYNIGGCQYYSNEMRGFNNIASTNISNISTNSNYNIDFYLERINIISDLTNNIAIPYITNDNATFAESTATQPPLKHTKVLKPYRVYSHCDISASYLKSVNEEMADSFSKEIQRALLSKAIETLLSSDAGNDTKPTGLLHGVSANSVSDSATLLQAIEEGNKLANDMVYIISPSAYTKLFTIAPNGFQNGKLFGKDFVIDNRLESGKMLLISLSSLYLCIWKYQGVTVDNVTKIIDGKVNITVESFLDFDIIPNRLFVVELN